MDGGFQRSQLRAESDLLFIGNGLIMQHHDAILVQRRANRPDRHRVHILTQIDTADFGHEALLDRSHADRHGFLSPHTSRRS